MAVTESAKHDLYTYLQETMGDERATTLMAMVSPTGWGDVATKQDLVLLRTEMTAEFKQVHTEFKVVRTEMESFVTKAYLEKALRTQMTATMGFFSVFTSIALAVARLMT